jgi:DNA-binding response OmpR family regulator
VNLTRDNAPRNLPLRVLVVEDDSPTAHAMELLLRHHGYDVLMANSVEAALGHVASEPHCVLLDLMLPDGDGMRVLEAVREKGLKSRVVVITGVGDSDYLARVHLLRPDALLRKPVDFFQILEKLSGVA